MKTIIAIAILLNGCAWSYEVEKDITKNKPCEEFVTTHWRCRAIRPLFFFDYDVSFCDTKEECNKFCEELRNKK